MSAKIQSVGILSLAVAGVFIVGCQSNPKQAKNAPPASSQLAVVPPVKAPDAPATQPVISAPAAPLPADALKDRIAAYAKEIGPIIEAREKATTQASATGPATQPAVAAVKPKQKEPEPRVVAIATPTVENQPSRANESISLEDKGSDARQAAAMRVSADDLTHVVAPAAQNASVAADLEAKLTKHLQESPKEVWAHLDYQLLQFLRDEQVPQLDSLMSLPIEDRELMSVVMDGLSNFRNALRADNNMLLSKKVKPLMELADRLRSQADLNIPVMALCTQVETFGVYTPIEPLRFLAGKDHEALLYCEVENFASTSVAEKKMWETRLSQEATLYTESGLPILTDKAGKIVDHSRNRRHDFYVVKRMRFPASLPLGRYLLKVTVEDQEAKRVAEQTMQVEIVAQLESDAAVEKQ